MVLRFALKFTWNKVETIQELFDSLKVGERPICRRLREGLGLMPYLTNRAVPSRFEGRWMQRRSFRFGLFRSGWRR